MLAIEHYQPVYQAFTPISLLVASYLVASPIGVGSATSLDRITAPAYVETASYLPTVPAWANTQGEIYTPIIGLDETAQIAAFEKFAGALASSAVAPLQYAVDILNKHFWDLI